MATKFRKGDIIEIDWVDTFGYNGWYTEKEILEKVDKMLESHVGYFITETKEYIIIAQGTDYCEDFADWNTPKYIPKGFIKRITKIKNSRGISPHASIPAKEKRKRRKGRRKCIKLKK